MKYASIADIRASDKILAKNTSPFRSSTPHETLLRIAAGGVAEFVCEMCGNAPDKPDVFVVFGNGNNGADAMLAGFALRNRGFDVKFLAAMARGEERGFVKSFCKGIGDIGIDWMAVNGRWSDWSDWHPKLARRGAVVIDGLMGIGISDPPRDGARKAIGWMNALKGRAKIVAVDIPSGFDPDGGGILGGGQGDIVRADFTICMGPPKLGMNRQDALQYCGSIYVNDLGMDANADAGADELVAECDVAPFFAPRRWDAHKGDFGHVCVVGGAPGYSGAPFLAALGATRAGAGLTSVLSPEEALRYAPQAPAEVMTHALRGAVCDVDSLRGCGFSFAGKTVVAGPGMSRFAGAREAVLWLARESGAAEVVLDADALSAFAGDAGALAGAAARLIITPHPGEAARLLGTSAERVQADRRAALADLVAATKAAVILKGAGTLVSAPGEGIHQIACANPGMAKGGMGDVLAGICGAHLARGLRAFDAARAAAWEHAAAADRAAWRLGHNAMQASDLKL